MSDSSPIKGEELTLLAVLALAVGSSGLGYVDLSEQISLQSSRHLRPSCGRS
jgi:hypothetical protein